MFLHSQSRYASSSGGQAVNQNACCHFYATPCSLFSYGVIQNGLGSHTVNLELPQLVYLISCGTHTFHHSGIVIISKSYYLLTTSYGILPSLPFGKGQNVNYLGFVGLVLFLSTTQPSHYKQQAATPNV
jgi:hypothetical protein